MGMCSLVLAPVARLVDQSLSRATPCPCAAEQAAPVATCVSPRLLFSSLAPPVAPCSLAAVRLLWAHRVQYPSLLVAPAAAAQVACRSLLA